MDLWLPLATIIAASLGLALGIEPIPSWYFLLLWWPFVVAVDALGRRRGGPGLLRDQTPMLLRLALLSVAWWTLFEAVNLRLGNWYYVMVDERRSVRWLFGAAAFATVLPGILATVRLLERRGTFATLRAARLRWNGTKRTACLLLGAFSLLAPLAWPETFYPLVWGSFAFLLAPWNRRFASRSFLRDLERGDPGPLCRTLLAGLVCGLVWECGNEWARQKWIYTVPGFEHWKLFEMPLLGFLGFPPFAVESLMWVRFVESLPRATASWSPAWRRWTSRTAGLLAALATLLVFWVSEPITTDSYYVPLARLSFLSAQERGALAGAGLVSPEQFLRRVAAPGGIVSLDETTGLGISRLQSLEAHLRLLTHRGLGARRLAQLDALGVRRITDLRGWNAPELAAALRARFGAAAGPFLRRRAQIWIDAAR